MSLRGANSLVFNEESILFKSPWPLRDPMVRTVLLLVLLTLLAPALAAEAGPVSFQASRACRVGPVPLDVPDCRASQAGEASLVGCDASTCTVRVAFTATAVGLPAGVREVEALVLADTETVVCGAQDVGAGDAPVACSGEAVVTVAVPGACRLFVVGSTATGNEAVSAAALTEIRVCREGGVTAP